MVFPMNFEKIADFAPAYSPLLDRTSAKIAVLIGAAIIGTAIPLYPEACLPILGLAFLCVVVKQPELGLLMIVASLGIFTDGWNRNRAIDDLVYRINIGKVYVTEFVVYGFAFIYIIRRILHRENKKLLNFKSPLDWILPLFALCIAFFMFYGYELTHNAAKAFGYHGGRVVIVGIVFYFLLANTLSGTESAIRVFKWFFVAGTLKALFGLMRYVGGFSGATNSYHGIPVPFVEIPETFALSVCVAGAAAAVAFGILKKSELIFVAAASSVMLLDIVLSLRRSVWLCLLVAMGVIFLLCPVMQRVRIALGCGLLAVVAVLAMGPDLYQRIESRVGFLSEIVERPELIGREEGDISFHYYDILDAWSAFQETPFGRGFPGKYRRVLTSSEDNLIERYLGTGLVHNEALNLAVKTGVIGLGLYLLCLILFSVAVLRSLRLTANPRTRALLATCLATILGGAALGLSSAQLMGDTKYPMLYFTVFALAMVTRSELLTEQQQEISAGKASLV